MKGGKKLSCENIFWQNRGKQRASNDGFKIKTKEDETMSGENCVKN